MSLTTLAAAVAVTDDVIEVVAMDEPPTGPCPIAINGERMLVYDGFGTTSWSVLRDQIAAGDSLLFFDGFDDREMPLGTDLGNAPPPGTWNADASNASANTGVSGGTAIIEIVTGGAGKTVDMTLADQPVNIETRFRFQIVDDVFSEVWGLLRRQGNPGDPNDYNARLQVTAAGALTLRLRRHVTGVQTNLAASVTPTGGPLVLGEWWVMAVRAVGTSPSEVSAKVWRESAAEPGWQTTASDSTAECQLPGSTAARFSCQGTSMSQFWMDDYKVSEASEGRAHALGDTVALLEEWTLPIVVQPGVGPPTSQPDTGAFYVDTNVEPPVFYVRVGSGWRSVTLT